MLLLINTKKIQPALFVMIFNSFFQVIWATPPSEITIKQKESLIIAKSDESLFWYPSLRQIDPNTLMVTIQTTPDEVNPDASPGLFCVSKDKGRNWTKPRPMEQESGLSWIRLNNGTFLNLGFCIMYQSDSVAKCRVGRSQDGLHYQWTDGLVDVAPHKFSKHPKGTAGMAFHRTILENQDGTLLASIYGQFMGDKLYRSILVSSRDGGCNWKYYSTVACDPNVGGEGFCEPSIVKLANGDLFCFLRNFSGKPMYSTRSLDNGKTWLPIKQMPKEYSTLSVDPDLLLLSNGVLACSAGRPDCHLMFSLDGTGTTWTKYDTIFSGPSLHYTSICQIAPDQIFFLHDVVPSGSNVMPKKGQYNEIRGVFITLDFAK